MAASPVSIVSVPPVFVSNVRRRPLALSPRRIEANRRNAARSTGPRTIAGKARVARNAIKHGFFASQERWTFGQHRDFAETLDGLREDFKPQGAAEESCVRTIAESYVRMAAMLRYENIAALRHHQQCERELNDRIAAANPSEAARLAAGREEMRRAGLWRPTIPGPRDARAILRYEGRLHRTIRQAASALEGLQRMRGGYAPRGLRAGQRTSNDAICRRENAKTKPLGGIADKCPDALRRTSNTAIMGSGCAKTNPPLASTSNDFNTAENAKTNPLSSTFMGNRHQRRRARAMARRRT